MRTTAIYVVKIIFIASIKNTSFVELRSVWFYVRFTSSSVKVNWGSEKFNYSIDVPLTHADMNTNEKFLPANMILKYFSLSVFSKSFNRLPQNIC